MSDILKKTANTIRALSMDAIQKANSGHPGLPMGMADVASVLYSEFLKFNPQNPWWINRDRFVLSGGHGSMLLYSLLHIFGYDLSLDDIKSFRQWGSNTPGHPEIHETPGVETTTGPLGQGLANAVGMALAETFLASKYNTEINIIDHYTYVFAGDGDLEEGISHEVCSFAGHHKLNKLIVFYDSNSITIDGNTYLSFTDDTEKRFNAYNWQVLKVDGHNYDEIIAAVKSAKNEKSKPSLIICKTIIGFGSPNKAGSHSVHGSPLGEEEVALTKQNLGLSPEKFYIPAEVAQIKNSYTEKGKKAENDWYIAFQMYLTKHQEAGKELMNLMYKERKDIKFPVFEADTKIATRQASGKILDEISHLLPGLIGGSADLTPSNNTKAKDQTVYSPDNRSGNYIHYGVREFGMGGIMNGLALHGGIIPYGGTFLVFSDYMRSAIRMAALMKIQVIYIFTHDSIGLGEDGPTHQPVEHLAALRSIPDLVTLRPMDANETSVAWEIAVNRTNGPTALVLTRQAMTTAKRNAYFCKDPSNAKKGAYVLSDDVDFEIILAASGSEVEIALKAKEALNKKGIETRVVSVMSFELFEEQTEEYKQSVFPVNIHNKIAIEAGISMPWYKYIGSGGKIIALNRFGASAPAEVLYEKFEITPENIVKTAELLIAESKNK
jgi:transketolase